MSQRSCMVLPLTGSWCHSLSSAGDEQEESCGGHGSGGSAFRELLLILKSSLKDATRGESPQNSAVYMLR